MSNQTTRSPSNVEDDINDLVLKLQALLPNSSSRSTGTVPASKIIQETCNYIKKLHREVEDLSGRLSQLLASLENNGVDVDIIRNILQQ